jgi:hypothetical protein
LEAAKADVRESVYEVTKRAEAGEKLLWETVLVEAPSFVTTHSEVAEFQKRLKGLLTEFRHRAKALRGGTPELTTMKFTYALRERPVTSGR